MRGNIGCLAPSHRVLYTRLCRQLWLRRDQSTSGPRHLISCNGSADVHVMTDRANERQLGTCRFDMHRAGALNVTTTHSAFKARVACFATCSCSPVCAPHAGIQHHSGLSACCTLRVLEHGQCSTAVAHMLGSTGRVQLFRARRQSFRFRQNSQRVACHDERNQPLDVI